MGLRRRFDSEISKASRRRFSFGAYDENLFVGLAIAEPHEWNRSLWVGEFHMVESCQLKGTGKRSMDRVKERAREADFRTIVCETQNTNTVAINVYRKLG
ncbi:MAG: GNAT family N-acetyltransferase [Planctomycetota bacterium]|nr:GNAT family N-acetyltransferase [Planctomycetota bacterium]MDA1141595.1 GNAT family N-acetyltransferase [Planctomycetota bacterium]